ncbi:MAG: metal-dependent hydrolase [Nitrososphaerota archaeon]|jgi:hypothetical protein|nr:metal-dependent hydrolase [Nitrososphaerota archaeon]
MALAYLLGKGASKVLHTKINIPLLLVLSILPDIDIVFGVLFHSPFHRGPTHSLIVAALIFIPVFIIYRKKAVPYFLGLISHFLIGDFIVGGQLLLLWPLSFSRFGLHELGFPFISIYSSVNVALELSLFVIATLVLIISRDWKVFFKGRLSNLVLIIPLTTVLLPSTIGYPFTDSLLVIEPALALAHIFYLVLFSIAVFATLVSLYRRWFGSGNKKPLA